MATLEGLKYREHDFTLSPGDSLFVYTDGVTEATNESMELMGEERMIDALNINKDVNTDELLMTVKREIDSFAGNAPQFDDITMMIFKYKGA